MAPADQFSVEAGGVMLAGEESGPATDESKPSPAVVLLHGLTATRRYVVMGSTALQRSGHRVIAYDARAHGRSAAAPTPGDYGYARLSDDLLAVLDARGVERAVLAGSSMGAHTLLRFALAHPERVAGLVVMTPAYDPESTRGFENWDRLARGRRVAVLDVLRPRAGRRVRAAAHGATPACSATALITRET